MKVFDIADNIFTLDSSQYVEFCNEDKTTSKSVKFQSFDNPDDIYYTTVIMRKFIFGVYFLNLNGTIVFWDFTTDHVYDDLSEIEEVTKMEKEIKEEIKEEVTTCNVSNNSILLRKCDIEFITSDSIAGKYAGKYSPLYGYELYLTETAAKLIKEIDNDGMIIFPYNTQFIFIGHCYNSVLDIAAVYKKDIKKVFCRQLTEYTIR